VEGLRQIGHWLAPLLLGLSLAFLWQAAEAGSPPPPADTRHPDPSPTLCDPMLDLGEPGGRDRSTSGACGDCKPTLARVVVAGYSPLILPALSVAETRVHPARRHELRSSRGPPGHA
jgi:hypothetical protein